MGRKKINSPSQPFKVPKNMPTGQKMGVFEQLALVRDPARLKYESTGDAYYAVAAIGGRQSSDYGPPEWALDAILKGVIAAWNTHQASDKPVSIDGALGLGPRRGIRPKTVKSNEKDSIESQAYYLIKTIHVCFDVSISDACEIVYHAIVEPHAVISSEQPTYGNRLGYSFDTLFDNYSRTGTHESVVPSPFSEREQHFFSGLLLVANPERCFQSTFVLKIIKKLIPCKEFFAYALKSLWKTHEVGVPEQIAKEWPNITPDEIIKLLAENTPASERMEYFR